MLYYFNYIFQIIKYYKYYKHYIKNNSSSFWQYLKSYLKYFFDREKQSSVCFPVKSTYFKKVLWVKYYKNNCH